MEHNCHLCGKPAIFIDPEGRDICRWCHPPHSNDVRNALNALLQKGLLPGSGNR